MKNSEKKASKKQLETSITEKFTKAIAELGHDAELIKKEIKKVSKAVAKKISKQLDTVKDVVSAKLQSDSPKAASDSAVKPVQKVKKSAVKEIEKVKSKSVKPAAKTSPVETPKADVVTDSKVASEQPTVSVAKAPKVKKEVPAAVTKTPKTPSVTKPKAKTV